VLSEQALQLSSAHLYGQVPGAVVDMGLVFREVYEWAGVQQASHWLDSYFFGLLIRLQPLFFLSVGTILSPAIGDVILGNWAHYCGASGIKHHRN